MHQVYLESIKLNHKKSIFLKDFQLLFMIINEGVLIQKHEKNNILLSDITRQVKSSRQKSKAIFFFFLSDLNHKSSGNYRKNELRDVFFFPLLPFNAVSVSFLKRNSRLQQDKASYPSTSAAGGQLCSIWAYYRLIFLLFFFI